MDIIDVELSRKSRRQLHVLYLVDVYCRKVWVYKIKIKEICKYSWIISAILGRFKLENYKPPIVMPDHDSILQILNLKKY